MVKPSVKVAAEESALIFIGKVTKITPTQLASGSYPLNGKKAKWEKYLYKTDIATFEVTQAFKGVEGDTVEIATSADGDAGYKFEGGTWMREGGTYLVYAYKRRPAGAVDTDWTGYDKGVARELKQMQESFPKELAAEINELNSRITPYATSICGRTSIVSETTKEELDDLHRIFPNARKLAESVSQPRLSTLEMVISALLRTAFG